MSRIGKLPIKIPSGVNIEINSNEAKVNGPKGSLSMQILDGISVKVEEDNVIVARENDTALLKARHGLIRSLLNNLVIGVSEGFSKKLEVNGVGFKVNASPTNLKLSVGFSHDVDYPIPEGIYISVEQNVITITGIDKQKVGQVAAEIRAIKKPEPYKGKGIKYIDERIIRKSGKSGKEK